MTSGASPDPSLLLACADLATDALAAAREEIDALNVYPVPDGDTGTNMFLTVSEARDALRTRSEAGDCDLAEALAVFSRGALLGARGNSGVILSQVITAACSRIGAATGDRRAAEVLAESFAEASRASYAAVGQPVEGTILSVLEAAAQAATAAAADPAARSRDVLRASTEAARAALERTPEQLQTLADAGVVDAGGMGLCVILEAVESSLTGRAVPRRQAPWGTQRIRVPSVAEHGHDLSEDGPSYEVMYLLDADDDKVAALRTRLGELGDSLVVVGGEGLWNVHVHTDDVGAAVEAGIEAGRPHRIRVTHFADQISSRRHERTERAERGGRAVVAVAAGPGLSRLFSEAGARVVPGGPGERPSTAMLLEAIVGSGAREVILLPNDRDTIRAAEAAARTAEESHDVSVVVIPTTAQVQGLAGVAVHEPGRVFEQDVLQMTAAARHTHDGALTVAARQAITSAGECRPGDALGVVGGDFAVVGTDARQVAISVLDRLLGAGGELVTVVHGAREPEGLDPVGLAEDLVAYLESAHPLVDVTVHDGGQRRYPLLFAVE